ncbi:VOC family protein [Gracilibacillus timonensis]|uniref:VOC family protein n=1 Tax=Gracilibacillus timonensis TaxID=1816696 RepID=UPI000A9539A5|nr:VOC family protein [Gracilibacillus timonensis]
MQKIVYHLWYDKEAEEAATFYTSIFPESDIMETNMIQDTPSGDVAEVSFKLWGQEFTAISAGPYFSFNPSISFMVNFDPARDKHAKDKLDEVWDKLVDGGTVLMPLDTYPFSDRYGWIQDKYGLSWQLILTNPEGKERPTILPSLMFVGDHCGKAEEAAQMYLSVFKDSRHGFLARYPAGMEPDQEGSVMFSDFMLENQWFAAMDSAQDHSFSFNEAISFMVYCDSQEELDDYWTKLSAVPEAEQCGWLKDRYSVSWQIVPRELEVLMKQASQEKRHQINQAILQMKKLDIQKIRTVYNNPSRA